MDYYKQKGQIVIPADVRKELDIKTGDKMMKIINRGNKNKLNTLLSSQKHVKKQSSSMNELYAIGRLGRKYETII